MTVSFGFSVNTLTILKRYKQPYQSTVGASGLGILIQSIRKEGEFVQG